MFLVMRPTVRPNKKKKKKKKKKKSICKAQIFVYRDHTHNNLSLVKESLYIYI